MAAGRRRDRAQRALDITHRGRSGAIRRPHRAGRSRADREPRTPAPSRSRPGRRLVLRADVADEQVGPFARGGRRRRRRSRSSRAATLTTATLAHATPQVGPRVGAAEGRAARERRSRRTATASRCSTSSTRARSSRSSRRPSRSTPTKRSSKRRARETERGARPARGPRRRALHGRRQPGAARRARRHAARQRARVPLGVRRRGRRPGPPAPRRGEGRGRAARGATDSHSSRPAPPRRSSATSSTPRAREITRGDRSSSRRCSRR